MNRAKIALFLHLGSTDAGNGTLVLHVSRYMFPARRQSGGALTAATRSGNPFPKPFIGQIGELKFANIQTSRDHVAQLVHQAERRS
jgi:hypothetical protein